MDDTSDDDGPAAGVRAPQGTLLLDLEVGEDCALTGVGAALGAAEVRWKPGRGSRPLAGVLGDLAALAHGASRVAGHNVLVHDLEHFAAAAPGHPLLALPVVDTLVLSPLAFPRKPYHSLVKDYKLVSETPNDPLADARLAARLLEDEVRAFRALVASDPGVAAVHRSALARWRPARGGVGAACAEPLAEAGAALLDDADVVAAFLDRVAGRVCTTAGPGAVAAALADPATRPAVAYALAWLTVAETRSAVPQWVRRSFPWTFDLLDALRARPCGAEGCAWCRSTHDPLGLLRRTFGYEEFRGAPEPASGLPLQHAAVAAGLAGRPLLAVFPTSFGKSLCFQLPAIARYERTGDLTVVVSPLQALMRDQVDVLEEKVRGRFAAALHGMLTPPERADVLARVVDGDVALLYVAPEQLRNRSFRKAIASRRVGAWVFDEAHCVSGWGHDFRTDYHHAAGMIREISERQGGPAPAIACFTATAKRDVRDDVRRQFREALGADLEPVEAPVERTNIRFRTQVVPEPAKAEAVAAALHDALGSGRGAAIVYLSTRKRTEEFANQLRLAGWEARAFHAGLEPPDKRRVQDQFKSDEVRVICATSAFGMGIDKPDVRLVVHADAPGSLEAYVQEAGRAGRDGLRSDALLLFAEEDLDRQFELLARSQLTRRDVGQVLQAVRRARRGGREEVVVSASELLRDERTDVSFDAGDRDARTKVLTAVSWLERGGLVLRDENHTRVFQARPLVRDLDEARRRVEALPLPERRRERWLRILQAFFSKDARAGLDLDDIAAAAGDDEAPAEGARPFEAPALRLLRTLQDMCRQGLLEEGVCLTAFVRIGIANPSAELLDAIVRTDEAMVGLLREEFPDAPSGDAWLACDLRRVNQGLGDRGVAAAPELLRKLLHALAEDGRAQPGGTGVVVRARGGDLHAVKLLRGWDEIAAAAKHRRRLAEIVLHAILRRAESEGAGRGEVLVPFTMADLVRETESAAGGLAATAGGAEAALERALLFLHDQRVVTLQNGLALFRQAMGLRVLASARGRGWSSQDHRALEFHYGERRFQIHAMGEYARIGAMEPERARRLVADYFALDGEAFIARWFAGREEEVRRAVTAAAYRRIVEELSPAQRRVVTSSARRNLLVLAGPGSGKTRAVVHRCAFLRLVERVPASSVLVLCFNRAAAHELRTRLRDLIGDAARGVQVSTFHALALRLTGRSLARRPQDAPADDDRRPPDFEQIVRDAVALLRGDRPVPGLGADELVGRLLEGYEHVLVDEYQDIDADQYELISAVAGRRKSSGERAEPAVLLAVGDDDQSVYGWRGADVSFLRKFEEDYDAQTVRLDENFRSTPAIVAAAAAVIAPNPGRMKEGVVLRSVRRDRRVAGDLASRDREARGRVQVLRVADRAEQVAAAADEIERLRLALGARHEDFAVLARTRSELAPLRAHLEERGTPVRRHAGDKAFPPLHRVREIASALDRLDGVAREVLDADGIAAAAGFPASAARDDPWTALLVRTLEEWRAETCGFPAPVAGFVEFLHEALADLRRGHLVGEGVLLSTAHAAKGLEFPHVLVLDGGWLARIDDPARAGDVRTPAQRGEEERRLFYVAMTRARDTLCLLRRADLRTPFVCDAPGAGSRHVVERDAAGGARASADALGTSYELLTLEDVFLDFAGRQEPESVVHARLAALRPGAPLSLRDDDGRAWLVDAAGHRVGVLSSRARTRLADVLPRVRSACVVAVVRRDLSSSQEGFRDAVRCDRWEVPLVELRARQ